MLKSVQRLITDNERTVLDLVSQHSGISRSELTRHTPWRQQSVYRLVDSLIAKDLLITGKPNIAGVGKPSPTLTLNSQGAYSFGISLNTDVVQMALVDLNCQLVDQTDIQTDPANCQKTLKCIKQTAKQMLKKHAIEPELLLGIGLSITGFRLNAADVFQPPLPLKEWSGKPLGTLLEKELGYPAWVENNANAAAIAETLAGVGREHSTFSYLTFNYGFGGCIIIKGRPLSGAHGNAGELSSLFTESEIPSRPALGELLKRLQKNGKPIDSIKELCWHFDPTWPGVQAWVEEVSPYLNLAIRALAATTDPSAIVFGGEAPPALLDLLIEASDPFPARSDITIVPTRPVLLRSGLAGDAAVLGSALLPMKQQLFL